MLHMNGVTGMRAHSRRVCCCCRTREKAESPAAALGGVAEVADYAEVAAGNATGDVLMNSTSIGMSPAHGVTPVEAGSLKGYKLVFDAVYTPLETRLLKVRHLFTSAAAAVPSTETLETLIQGSGRWILLPLIGLGSRMLLPVR